MTLNRISNGALNKPNVIEQYKQTPKQRHTGRPEQGDPGLHRETNAAAADQADISAQARQRLEQQLLMEVGQEVVEHLPDVRAPKLAEVRQRLTEGFYASAEVRDHVADRLSRLFLQQDLF